jgi:hypothetical protein
MSTFLTRKDIAEVLELSYPVVKNWSQGKLFRIAPPSVRAPGKRALGKRGARNQYGIHDLYTMGIAAQLLKQGLNTDFVHKLLGGVQSRWLGSTRGVLVYGVSPQGEARLVHVSRDVQIGTITKTLARDGIYACGWLDLKRLLDRIDSKVRSKIRKETSSV